MHNRDIERPHGIDEVAAALLDVDFPIDRERAAARIEHILVEDREGRLISAAEALNRSDERGFHTSEEVVVAVAEGLGVGILESPLSEVTPDAGPTPPADEQPAASADDDQSIDEVERDGSPSAQVIASDEGAKRAEDKERLRSRQRAPRYEVPDGPEEEPALNDTGRPALLDPASARGSKRD